MNKFLQGLLGAGLYLLEQSNQATKTARERAKDRMDDLSDAAHDKFQMAARRITRASRAIQGADNSSIGNVLRFAAGLGIGVGVGLLLAPASGDETRSAISGTAREFGAKVRRQFSDEPLATGTRG